MNASYKLLTPLYNAIKEQMKRGLQLDESCFYYDKIYSDIAEYPKICLTTQEDFRASEDQSQIDLTNEIKADTTLTPYIVTDDLDDLVRMEEFINGYYSESQMLSEVSEELSVKYTTVRIEGKAGHDTLKGNYLLNFKLIIEEYILTKEIISPTKIELDKKVQKQIMNHLAIINIAWKRIYDIRDSEENRESYEIYSQQLADLEDQIKSTYNFQELTGIDMTLEDSSFAKCYEIMIEEKVSLSQACDLYQNQKIAQKWQEKEKEMERARLEKEKNERIQFLQQRCLAEGDESVNRYTDLVVQDVQDKLNLSYSLFVYGGSNYLCYYYDDEVEGLNYPLILIRDNIQFLDETDYATESETGEPVTHKVTIRALPVEYRICMLIMSKSDEQLKEIEDELTYLYQHESMLRISDPIYKTEKDVLRLEIDKEKSIEHPIFNVNGQPIYQSILNFKSQKLPYYVKDYTADTMENNPRLQLNQLKLANCYQNAINTIHIMAHSQSANFLKDVTDGKPMGCLYMLTYTDEYKELKRCFTNHLPVDKEMFEKQFANIVKYHPNLYNEVVVKKKPVEVIINDMDVSSDAINKIFQTLCDNLNLPSFASDLQYKDGRDKDIINYYISVMEGNDLYTIEDALSQYKRLLEEKRKEEAKRQQEEAERQQEEAERQQYEQYDEGEDFSNSDGTGSGLGFLGTVAAATIGSSLGQHGIRKELKKQTKIMEQEKREAKKARQQEERREYEQWSQRLHDESLKRVAESDAIRRRRNRGRR